MGEADPTMEARQLEDGSGWYVLIVWPTGPEQHVNRFLTEAAARAWINGDSKAWTTKAKHLRP